MRVARVSRALRPTAPSAAAPSLAGAAQDLYGKIMARCAPSQNVEWRVLDPRLFQSGCFPKCGCTFTDKEVAANVLFKPKFARGKPYLNGTAVAAAAAVAVAGRPRKRPSTLCGPHQWADWYLMHFPCSGGTTDKRERMASLLNGMKTGEPAFITSPDRRRRRRAS